MNWNWFQWATFLLGLGCFIVAIGCYRLEWWRLGTIYVLYGIVDWIMIGIRAN